MILFLLSFVLLYGGVHAYAFIAARRGVGFGSIGAVLLAILMGVMVLAPVLVRQAEHQGMEKTARALAFTGYGWMGLLFFFFSSSISIKIYNGLLLLAGKVTSFNLGWMAISAKPAFFFSVAFACVASVYGVFEALHIKTERIVIHTDKISETPGKLTIVQVSDVHLGLIVREARVQRIIDAIRLADPDMVVSTGDLVDGQLDGLSALANMLGEIKPRYGKFAVTGNHEFYAGIVPSLYISTQAGFTMLRGQFVTVADSITIAGVDDPAGERMGTKTGMNEQDLLAKLPRDRFTVLLKHRPKVEQNSLGLFDLQLSGHVHKGQIFPFNLITFVFYPVKTGLTELSSGSSLYVSRGTGTWGPPIRFFAPPELTIVELIHRNASSKK